MTDLAGKNAYVRWMDDQAIGINSRAEGLRLVSAVGASLANLYLTPNAKKTKILSLKEAKIHFHLETNAKLDALEKLIATRALTRNGPVQQIGHTGRSSARH